MSERQDGKYQDYLDLVQELLDCQEGEEQTLLAKRSELIDENLVMALLAVAEMLTERDGREAEATVDWLVNFAQDLAGQLGVAIEDKSQNEDYEQEDLDFLNALIEAEQRDEHQVKALFAQNLESLTMGLGAIMKIYIEQIVATQPQDAEGFVALIENIVIRLYEFPLGNRAQNMEIVIAGLVAVLTVRTRENHSQKWAQTQNNLAAAYSDRIKGDKAENIEKAISFYEAALSIRKKEDFPIQWAGTQNNLAAAYSDRIKWDKAENIEKAISCYEAALEICKKEDFPIQWATTQNNLAVSYKNRIKGDKAENIEKAISCYEAALSIRTKEDFPIQWAGTKNNLAGSWSDRIKGDKAENIEKAIACYEAALEIYKKEDFPIQWATTQNNLAVSYKNRIKGDKSENMEKAIVCYEAALEIRTKGNFPIQWATTQNNLANVYGERIEGHKAENLEKSIGCYEAALEIRTKENFPIEWAGTQENIAIFYLEKGQNDLAIEHYLKALEIFTPETLPINVIKANRGIGNIYLKQEHWQKAIEAYKIAMQSAETSRSWSVNDTERQRVLQTALSVYENAIQCAINLKDYRSAIEYTERVRSRQLVELMASKDLYGDAQVPAEIQAYLTEYRQLNEDIENLREGGDRTMSATKTSRDSQTLRADNEKINSLADRKQILYDKIRTHDPVLAGQIAIAPISHSEIQKLITNAHTAILTCYSTNDHTHIFILKQNQEPELFTCTGQGWNEFQKWLIENWLNPYKQEDNSAWRDRMPSVLAEIAERLQLPQLIADHLSDIQELVLVPHLLLHQIPFAALPTGNSEELLGEKFTIRSIPSCQILKYCQDRSPILTSTQGIVEDADDSLLGARYEGQKIAEIHGVLEIDRLRGKSQATIANYRQLLSRVNRLHSSHHASSNLENPLESALFLADGKITLGDLLMGEKYPNLDEIFLSACETHLGKFTFTDDVATLTTGFLCIGARSVQSTLWSVDDLVTALFDIFYHEARRDGLDRARSLQSAQNRLRNLTGEEFKLYHFPKLIEHVNADSSARIAALKQQIKKLYQQQSTLSNQTEEWQELAETMKSLTQKIKSIESIPEILEGYCTMDRPFESSFYWAGFICQGMA